jgi:hypothetical protein
MMHRDSGLTRVFLVGCPRSGTTLLQALLAAHPRISSFPESHFFGIAKARHRVLRTLGIASRNIHPRLHEFVGDLGLGNEFPAPRRFVFEQGYGAWFIALLDTVTRREGNDVWVEKTPSHIAHIREIEKLVPSVRFVHLVRNGRDVVASLYDVTHAHPEAWGGPRGVDACIERWLRDISTSARHLGRPNHLIVRYEQLVADPTSILTETCGFLGIAFSDEMLEGYGAVSSRIVLEKERWKSGTHGPLLNANEWKFHDVLTSEQQRYVSDRLAVVDLDRLFDAGQRLIVATTSPLTCPPVTSGDSEYHRFDGDTI